MYAACSSSCNAAVGLQVLRTSTVAGLHPFRLCGQGCTPLRRLLLEHLDVVWSGNAHSIATPQDASLVTHAAKARDAYSVFMYVHAPVKQKCAVSGIIIQHAKVSLSTCPDL